MDNNDATTEISGGLGERSQRSDMALIRRAIKGGWNIPEETKRKVIEQLSVIVEFSADERYTIAAAKVLVAADAVDLKTEQGKQEQTAATTVNVQVNNVSVPIPIAEPKRVEEALAILDAARARAVPVPDPAEADILHPAQTNGTAKPISSNGVH